VIFTDLRVVPTPTKESNVAEEERAVAAEVVVVPPKPLPAARQAVTMSVDRAALRTAIGALANPNAKQDWCIACGAGKSASPIDKVEAIQPLAKDLLGGQSLTEFLDGLKDFGKQAWCIACGAGKDASPLDLLGDPAEISDAAIDALAGKLLSSIRMG
jgi:hypothetical protein